MSLTSACTAWTSGRRLVCFAASQSRTFTGLLRNAALKVSMFPTNHPLTIGRRAMDFAVAGWHSSSPPAALLSRAALDGTAVATGMTQLKISGAGGFRTTVRGLGVGRLDL